MSTRFDMQLAANELIDRFYGRFTCIQGEPKAFFELPQKDGSVVRGIYVTYAIRGRILEDAKQYFIDKVITPLAEKATDVDELQAEAAGPFLYWRLPKRVDVEFMDNYYVIRTRIAVFDNELNPVEIDDMIKREGELAPMCAYEAGVAA